MAANIITVGLLVAIVSVLHEVNANSQDIHCQVTPNEYAFQNDTVSMRFERASANCRPYDENAADGANILPQHYIHCNGTPLRLTDFDLGTNQSQTYYTWRAGQKYKQILFIFRTAVNLTTTIVHYYNGNGNGHPQLKVYAVSDDFQVWHAPSGVNTQYSVAQQSENEPLGQRNVTISMNFTTKRVLIQFKNQNEFSVSEVQFFSCTHQINLPESNGDQTTGKHPNYSTIKLQTTSHAEPITPSIGISEKGIVQEENICREMIAWIFSVLFTVGILIVIAADTAMLSIKVKNSMAKKT